MLSLSFLLKKTILIAMMIACLFAAVAIAFGQKGASKKDTCLIYNVASFTDYQSGYQAMVRKGYVIKGITSYVKNNSEVIIVVYEY